MQAKALHEIARDINGSIVSRILAAKGKETVSDLIHRCQTKLDIERAIASGDALKVRQTLRPLYRALGWRWDANVFWLTS